MLLEFDRDVYDDIWENLLFLSIELFVKFVDLGDGSESVFILETLIS